jgi:plastocyanin
LLKNITFRNVGCLICLTFKALKTIHNDFRIRCFITSITVLLFTLLSSFNNPVDYAPTPATVKAIPPPLAVWIQGFGFNTVTITVPLNSTIKWTNMDGVAHSVTSDTNLFDSGSIASNGTFSFLFTTRGSFSYHCTFHPFMTGTVVVQ